MTAPSIVGRLQAGFAFASAVIVAALALALHIALTEALDREDELVLQGQARAILSELETHPGHAVELADHPEKAEWRLLGPSGVVLARSRGMVEQGIVGWPWMLAGLLVGALAALFPAFRAANLIIREAIEYE